MQPHHVLLVLTLLTTAQKTCVGVSHALPSDPIEVTVNPPTPPQTPATASSSGETVTAPLSSSRPVSMSSAAVTTEDDVTTAELTTSNHLMTHHDNTSPPPTPTAMAMQTTTPISVSTNCSQTALYLSPASPDEEKQLVVTFPPSAVGHSANCTWILPALDNNTSNVFSFHTTYDLTVCNGTQPSDYVALYNVPHIINYRLLIADSCSGPGWKSTDLWGSSTVIQFLSDNVTSTTIALGTYSSSTRPSQMCRAGSGPFVAESGPSVFTYPGDGLRIPSLAQCTWTFRAADPQGVVSVQISNHNSDVQKVWCHLRPGSKLYMSDKSYPEVGNYIHVNLCPEALNMTYQSFGSRLIVNLAAFGSGGAAPLSIQYSSMGPEVHCPVQSPRVIAVGSNSPAPSNFIMGMNRVGDHGQPQTCTWKLVAPDGMVIRFNHLYSKDYNSSAGGDTLQFDSGAILALGDTHTFPVWSESSTSLVQFHTHPRRPREAVRNEFQRCTQGPMSRSSNLAGHHVQRAEGDGAGTVSEQHDC